MITMPYGNGSRFDPQELVQNIQTSGRDYIIIGGCNCTLADHQKPHSLDVWLRGKTNNGNVRQSCQELVDAIVETGLFVFERGLRCPDSGHACGGLRLLAHGGR